MNNLKLNLTIKRFFLNLCFLLISLFINAQDNNKTKNNFSVGAGISIPNLYTVTNPKALASNGSNFSISYGREVYRTKKSYFTLDFKYASFSNPYSNLNSDIDGLNANASSAGIWDGTSDNFKLSTYLLGTSWFEYISKDEKWSCFFKIYLGSGSLTFPEVALKSTSGFFMTQNELKSNSFLYSTCGGISYDITKNISLGVNFEVLKSLFTFNNQEITYSGGSEILPTYTINYTNIGVNSGLTFKF
jgi:hypothetical protein